MPDDLFTIDLRRRLLNRGWATKHQWGQVTWQRPEDKAWLSEEEAIKQLARLDVEESHGD